MIWVWLGFVLLILFFLALDLGVFHRKAHAVGVREALAWSGVWLALGALFGVFVYFGYDSGWMGLGRSPDGTTVVDPLAVTAANPLGELDGATAALKYATGYLVEKSLSVDNVFVIATIFALLAVPARYQHRVLFWGVLGALVMRGIMVAVGAKLVAEFTWVLYVFGAFLIATAVKMLLVKDGHKDPNDSPMVKLARRFLPVTERFHGEHFLVRAGTAASREAAEPGAPVLADRVVDAARPGALLLTPLALALVLVEAADLVFAVDSIPAIFAITGDPFLVFTCNVFAILGLRSLYFALAGLADAFVYLKPALAVVLGVVGLKLIFHGPLKELLGANFNLYLLGLIVAILTTGVLASVIAKRRAAARALR